MGQLGFTTPETQTLLEKIEDEGGISSTISVYGTDAGGTNIVEYTFTFLEGRLTAF